MNQKIVLTDGYGIRLQTARLACGYSQLELARAALSEKASARNIWRIERQEVCPTKDTLLRICAKLQISPAWLFYDIPPDASDTTILRVPGIGERIREARLRKGYSQRYLARITGLGDTAQNVGRIEKAQVYPRLGTVRRISRALRVPLPKLAFDF